MFFNLSGKLTINLCFYILHYYKKCLIFTKNEIENKLKFNYSIMMVKTQVLLCTSRLLAFFLRTFIWPHRVLGVVCGIYFPVQKLTGTPAFAVQRLSYREIPRFFVCFVLGGLWGGFMIFFSFWAKVEKEERGRNCVNKGGTWNEIKPSDFTSKGHAVYENPLLIFYYIW